MKYIIDRFEGGFAVCYGEDDRRVTIDRALIPPAAKEGSPITFDGEAYSLSNDDNDRERLERMEQKRRKVFGGSRQNGYRL